MVAKSVVKSQCATFTVILFILYSLAGLDKYTSKKAGVDTENCDFE